MGLTKVDCDCATKTIDFRLKDGIMHQKQHTLYPTMLTTASLFVHHPPYEERGRPAIVRVSEMRPFFVCA